MSFVCVCYALVYMIYKFAYIYYAHKVFVILLKCELYIYYAHFNNITNTLFFYF